MNRLACVMLLLLSGCTAFPTTNTEVSQQVPAGTLDAPAAQTALAQLKVAAPGRMDGYSRSCDDGGKCLFGQPWFDADGDGCDQRSQVLARDLVDVVRKDGRCAVKSGTLHDPYTGTTVTSVSKIQIDHVVPLAEMWRSGAAAWTTEQRTAAANDLRNLLAVQGKTNQAKGDQTPDRWMPPNTAYACPRTPPTPAPEHRLRLPLRTHLRDREVGPRSDRGRSRAGGPRTGVGFLPMSFAVVRGLDGMSKVLWHLTMSLDGFIAGPNHEMAWMAGLPFREGVVDEYVAATGAILAGRRGYDAGYRYESRAAYGGSGRGRSSC